MPRKSVSSLSQTVIGSPGKSCKLGVAAESQDGKTDSSSSSSTWSLKWEGQGPRLPLASLIGAHDMVLKLLQDTELILRAGAHVSSKEIGHSQLQNAGFHTVGPQ